MVRLKQLRYVSASTQQNLVNTTGMAIQKIAHIIHLDDEKLAIKTGK